MALQVLGQLLANIVDCLVCKATDHNSWGILAKMLGRLSKWHHVACLLEPCNEFLRNCGLASTCCTYQAEGFALQAKLNGSKLLSIEAHATAWCLLVTSKAGESKRQGAGINKSVVGKRLAHGRGCLQCLLLCKLGSKLLSMSLLSCCYEC